MLAAGRRRAPRATGAAVEGGLRAPGRSSAVVRVRRCVSIWSITDAWVMKARIRMVPWHVGHTSGSTSKICRSTAALWRAVSVPAVIHNWGRERRKKLAGKR